MNHHRIEGLAIVFPCLSERPIDKLRTSLGPEKTMMVRIQKQDREDSLLAEPKIAGEVEGPTQNDKTEGVTLRVASTCSEHS